MGSVKQRSHVAELHLPQNFVNASLVCGQNSGDTTTRLTAVVWPSFWCVSPCSWQRRLDASHAHSQKPVSLLVPIALQSVHSGAPTTGMAAMAASKRARWYLISANSPYCRFSTRPVTSFMHTKHFFGGSHLSSSSSQQRQIMWPHGTNVTGNVRSSSSFKCAALERKCMAHAGQYMANAAISFSCSGVGTGTAGAEAAPDMFWVWERRIWRATSFFGGRSAECPFRGFLRCFLRERPHDCMNCVKFNVVAEENVRLLHQLSDETLR